MRIGSMIIIGGCAFAAERGPIKSIEEIEIEHNEEKLRVHSAIIGSFNTARRSPSVFIRNDILLIAGGCIGPNEHLDSMETIKIDGKTRKIEDSITSNHVCVQRQSCAAFDPYAKSNLIFGGFDSHQCLSTVQLIDENYQAINVDGCLPKLKNSAAIEVRDNEFLLFGGWMDERNTTDTIRRIRFNGDRKTFEAIFEGFLEYPVEGHSITKHKNVVYLIGGFDGVSIIPHIMRYELDTKKCTKIDVYLNEKRENHVAGLIGQKYLVVAGGWNGREALKSIEVFEILEESPFLKKCEISGDVGLKVARNRPASIVI